MPKYKMPKVKGMVRNRVMGVPKGVKSIGETNVTARRMKDAEKAFARKTGVRTKGM